MEELFRIPSHRRVDSYSNLVKINLGVSQSPIHLQQKNVDNTFYKTSRIIKALEDIKDNDNYFSHRSSQRNVLLEIITLTPISTVENGQKVTLNVSMGDIKRRKGTLYTYFQQRYLNTLRSNAANNKPSALSYDIYRFRIKTLRRILDDVFTKLYAEDRAKAREEEAKARAEADAKAKAEADALIQAQNNNQGGNNGTTTNGNGGTTPVKAFKVGKLEKKSKVGLYVGIGVGALVVIGGGFALYKHFSK